MVQVNKLTREEKIKMYMKCSKKELISMLLENEKALEPHLFCGKATEENPHSLGTPSFWKTFNADSSRWDDPHFSSTDYKFYLVPTGT